MQKKNVRTWSSNNPHAGMHSTLNSPKFYVFRAPPKQNVLTPFCFAQGVVTGGVPRHLDHARNVLTAFYSRKTKRLRIFTLQFGIGNFYGNGLAKAFFSRYYTT
jgi:hypothetical protein